MRHWEHRFTLYVIAAMLIIAAGVTLVLQSNSPNIFPGIDGSEVTK